MHFKFMTPFNVITYTHSNCKDVWPAYCGELYSKFPNIIHYAITNEINNDLKCHDSIINPDNGGYSVKWLRALEKIPDDNNVIIYMQEDFFLFDNVDTELLNRYRDILLNDASLSFIRLIKSGINSEPVIYDTHSTLFNVNYHYDIGFSMQPTLWKKEKLQEIFELCPINVPHEEGKITNYVLRSLNVNGVYHYNNERKAGINHYDSSVFPYVATGIIKGKWNTYEYSEQLHTMFTKYNIDKNIRGEYKGEHTI